jgi:methyl-accepting chemotaxis protein
MSEARSRTAAASFFAGRSSRSRPRSPPDGASLPRMGRHALAAFAIVLAALALVAAGCGDDEEETSSAAAWAEDFCTTVTDWQDELDRIADGLSASSSTEDLEDAANEASDATDAFVEELRDLGGPDTESGEAVEDSLDELSDTVDAEKAELEEAVDDAEGLTGAAGAIAEIGSSVAAIATALETTLQAIEDGDASGELETALEETPACDELTNDTD